MSSFYALLDKGHTVVVVEHNMDVAKCADHIIDLGPKGGKQGGTIVAQGPPTEVIKATDSATAPFLRQKFNHILK